MYELMKCSCETSQHLGQLHTIITLDQAVYFKAKLPGFQAPTGCDSTSAFVGKEKVAPFKLLQADEGFMKTMQKVGQEFEVGEELLAGCEKFVCHCMVTKVTM